MLSLLLFYSFPPWNKIMKFQVGMKFLIVFTFYCCVTKYHKLSGLKLHPFISSQFCTSEVWDKTQMSSLGSYKVQIKLIELHFFLETHGNHSPLNSFRLLGKFNSLKLQNQGIHSLAGRQMGSIIYNYGSPHSLSCDPFIFKASKNQSLYCKISLML